MQLSHGRSGILVVFSLHFNFGSSLKWSPINPWETQGLVVSVLISRSRGPGLSPGRVIVLCSWARHFTLTVPLSTPQGNKWVPGKNDKMLGVTCNGLASYPGGVAIFQVTSCYRNWESSGSYASQARDLTLKIKPILKSSYLTGSNALFSLFLRFNSFYSINNFIIIIIFCVVKVTCTRFCIFSAKLPVGVCHHIWWWPCGRRQCVS